ncbi:hypothetical protein [Aquibium oceanicum]|uniref:Uncharacterized protein n=1 Tax=Aquibium oceanicum TaxID=1670800 RepID=A0A1L3SMD7_9HYPH|nr:hypothetical protein [Aquibium oceanicum]APH70576.1 hypothetical protein BSQ44_03635 [Aquibium oceanicum]
MPTLNKQASRREEADDRKTVVQKTATQKAKQGDASTAPFHGSPHAEHPRDPFRNMFGTSRMKFEF